MMKKEIMIVLPGKIPVLRDGIDTPLKRNIQEFNIYFKNIILPYKEEYDIQVRCSYGRNFGTFWRLSEYPHDVDNFDFEIVIYNEYGECIASKKARIELYDRKETDEPYNIICVGDSMTFAQKYMEQIAANLHNIVFKGSRNVFGHIAHEGRGGWSYENYFHNYKDNFGVSPFLFPEGVDKYIGEIDFINKVNADEHLDYLYTGFEKHDFTDGCIYCRDEKLYLYRNGTFELYCAEPEWKFDFQKYVERYQIGHIDAVSVLLGANDLQFAGYEESEEKINAYIRNTEKFINAVHEYDKEIDVVINLPVIGAEQYAWGVRCGCSGSSKMYRYNIIHAGKALLDRWENSEEEHIYICPMLLCIAPDYGFPKEYYNAGRYSEAMEVHQSNWVHPNQSGYYQMGDCLCGTIQKIRHM